MAEICAPHCSVCKSVCCRADFCRENIDCLFLTLLSSPTLPNSATYNAGRGWLTASGCALSAGRPPVCYQFTCQKIMDALPDDTQRYLLSVLSELIPHLGKHALGSRHLVEIMDISELARVDFSRFQKRLSEAHNALEAIRSFAENGRLPDSALEALKRIKLRPDPTASRTGIPRCIKHSSACGR